MSSSCILFLYLSDVFASMQDLTMKLSLIQSVGLVAKAISRCVKKQSYIFSRKQELVTVLMVSVISNYEQTEFHHNFNPFFSFLSSDFTDQDFMKSEPSDSLRTPVRPLVMTTCANLMYPSFPYSSYVYCVMFFLFFW